MNVIHSNTANNVIDNQTGESYRSLARNGMVVQRFDNSEINYDISKSAPGDHAKIQLRPKLLSPSNELNMDALDNMIIATHDKTIAPTSQLEASGHGDIGFSQPAFRENGDKSINDESKHMKSRVKYTLKQDHTPTAIVPGMLEIPPPESTVLGGMS